ncbi:phosphonate C-P lyase system protein PhnG [Salinarimonas ramus]|uniref:Protein phnG n=1 Tax=Salinarimonas ramus TaxID=690164 RepID=A0A917Q716_9HYPH|nr:phosphonate C-P lyase system protein PhnG [Salinarimonas ramus]GGK30182.1 protein phnG [Salinarimonas ramus]
MTSSTTSAATPQGVRARQAAMRLCALARTDELDAALAALDAPADVADLRRPETGLVMTRGRIGGDGRPFNAGEATVTRAAVRLPTGEAGFAYHLGRDAVRARKAAILDALFQARPDAVEVALAPVADRVAAERAREARQVAATKVDFFTMVRGED